MKQSLKQIGRSSLLITCLVLTACGCSSEDTTDNSNFRMMEKCGFSGWMAEELQADGFEMVKCAKYLPEFRQIETGVHYYFCMDSRSGKVMSIAPVYKSDGAIKTTIIK